MENDWSIDSWPLPSCKSDGNGMRFSCRGGCQSATNTKQGPSTRMTYKARMKGPRGRQHSNKTKSVDRIRRFAPMSFRLFKLTRAWRIFHRRLPRAKSRVYSVNGTAARVSSYLRRGSQSE